MKTLNRVKVVIASLAAILSLWAAIVCALQFGGLGRMLFVENNLPRRSFEAFLHEIPRTVMEDVCAGHENGIRMVAIPLILTSILWFSVYLITEVQRKRNEGGGEERR